MKVLINLRPHTFASFKKLVAQTFPAWKVNDFAPVVYVSQREDAASVFSITGYEFTEQDKTALNDLAAQAEYVEPVESNFCPVITIDRNVVRNKIRAQANRFRFRSGR